MIQTVFVIGSSSHALEDLKQDPICLRLIKFSFRRKDLPQLQQLLFPCNVVNAVEQVGVPKLSFLTVEMCGLWDNSVTVAAYSKEKLLFDPVLSFFRTMFPEFFQTRSVISFFFKHSSLISCNDVL